MSNANPPGDEAPTPAPAEGAGAKKLSKKELRKLERERQAAEQRAQKAAEAEKNKEFFGDVPLMQSQEVTSRTWTRLAALTEEKHGETVLVRARLHTVRSPSRNLAFGVLRQSFHTVQAVVHAGKDSALPKEMVKFVAEVPNESIVDVEGELRVPDEPVTGTSQPVELHVTKFHVVSRALASIPFQVTDAMQPEATTQAEQEAEGDEAAAAAAAAAASGAGAGAGGQRTGRVKQDTRLDSRWIDLRTPANQAIVRISSGVCSLFRDFLLKRGFVEIQTPKLLGGSSEGGSAVFKLDYFGQTACLAQSPQLYKQMCAACSDLERVFEIGPVFRAEKSHTHRHLCEFHGLDMEMAFNEHYNEVLDVFSDLFIHIFEGLQEHFKGELEAVRSQFPFEDFKFQKPALKLTWDEGIKMLQDAGFDVHPREDLSSETERELGRLVKEKYDTDFFIMDKYPLAIRPFYTMPDPTNPELSNSYDFFMRGEEILSGAQRIHEAELLEERAQAHEIPVETIRSYIDSFKHGALPHAGGGIGLERVVMLFLGLKNIRQATIFPRDPRRLAP